MYQKLVALFSIYLFMGQHLESADIPLYVRLTNLSEDLLKGYNKHIAGSSSGATDIKVTIGISSLLSFEEVEGKLSIVAKFLLSWKDKRMTWKNIDAYKDIRSISFPASQVWKPTWILTTSNTGMKVIGSDSSMVFFYRNGYAVYQFRDLLVSSCILDTYKYPYDTQNCVLKLESLEVDNKPIYKYLRLTVSHSRTVENGIWDITNTKIVHRKWNKDVLKIMLTLKRRPEFYVINLILPMILLGIINILVFLLPIESGERVGYSITVMLAIAVFQTIAFSSIPNVSIPRVSLLCVKLFAENTISGFITMVNIISIRLYYMRPDTHIPGFLCGICKFILCTLRYRSCLPKKKVNKNNKDETTSTESSNINAVTWVEISKAFDVAFAILAILGFFISNTVFFLTVIGT